MADVTKRVKIVFENQIKDPNKVKRLAKFYDEWTKKLNTTQSGVNRVMGAAGLKFDKMGFIVNHTGKQVKEYTSLMERSSSVLQRFEMNYLGVMFAGMALNRTMANLTATSREWLGVNELLSDMMGIVMLPATLDLLDYGVLPLFDALTSLPEEAQRAIGYVSYALQGLGGVLMTTGQLALGASSIMNILKGIGGGSVIKGIDAVSGKLAKLFDSKLARGIGWTGAAVFTISDIFLEEADDFEWEKKLGASAFVALATKGGLSAKLKGGVVTFSILTAIEFVQDPKGTGKAFADIVNMAGKYIDFWYTIGEWIRESIISIFTKAKMPQFPTLMEDYSQGFYNRLAELQTSGKLSKTIESLYGKEEISGRAGFLGEMERQRGVLSSNVVVSPTYNVTVSNKDDFEVMLRKNTDQITSLINQSVRT